VAVFENRTGDRALDSLGTVAAERLIQGLAEAHIGDPIPTPMTPAEARSVRAGVLITGVFDQQGDTLTIQARVVRGVDGKVLYTPEPVPLEKARAVDMLPSIHQDVKAFVDLYVQGVDVSVLSRIPILEAEREYTSGLELFGRDTARSLGHFQRALEIDPRFVSPRLFVIATFMIARRWDEAARATAPLVRERHRLSKYEQSWVDRFVAEQAGQHTAALDAMLEAERVAPDDYFVNVSIGASLLRLNRPAAALATFAKMPEPDWMSRVGARGLRLTVALDARHLLGDFEGERREAIAARHWVPGVAANAEARSLMALGRTPEALQVVDDLLTVPGAARDALTTAVRELRAHDRRQESIDLANRMVERYRSQTPDPATAEAARHGLAGAFYSAERWDEAQAIVRKLAQGTPDNPEYLGLLGAIAARRGERAEALRSSDALRRLSQPYLFGSHTMWRARIAALLGEHELAVDLLRDAIAQGAYFTIGTHRDMDLESLKTNAAFRELMRPKE
jgi:tetratricopeptide (TPR) repeat protein